jgi:hypothetical protein
MWYQQGSEIAKKAYNEYLNALNQYMNCPPDQFEHKMEEAGKMNALIQSMVQGLSIGLEGAEDIQRRTRAGDTAAPIEMNTVKNTMEKMLKTIWVHNTAAASAKMAGLEVKLLESQMVSRISKAIGVPLTDYGIQLQSAEDADTIWMEEPEMPPEVMGLQQEDVAAEETPMTEGEEAVTPEEEEVAVPPEEAPAEDDIIRDENGNPIGADMPSDAEVETEEGMPMEDVDTVAEEEPIEEEIIDEEVPEEKVMDEEIADEEGEIPIDEELADEGEAPTEEEFPNDEEPIDEEGFVDEEAVPEETVDEFPEDTEPVAEEGFAEEAPLEEMADGEEVPAEEEVVDEEVPEEEVVEEEPTEEIEEIPDEEEEESLYCIMCDQYVTPDEIAACEEENCPFRNVVGNAVEEEPVEEVPIEEDIQKHFVLLDQEDHSEHKVYGFTVKEFTGAEGEYCLDCGKAVSYSFEQKTWSSEDAKKWVQKQNKVIKVKEKTAEVIIQESLDKIPDNVFKELQDERKAPKGSEIVTKEFEDLKIDIDKNVLREVLDEVFNPISNRLKALEA